MSSLQIGLRVLNRLSPAPAAIVAFAALPVTASAHPHVFADTEIGFAFDDDGTVTSLRVKWTYDEFTTLTLYAILGLDSDGDGALDDIDFAKIVEGETNWPPGYKGDLHLAGPAGRVASDPAKERHCRAAGGARVGGVRSTAFTALSD